MDLFITFAYRSLKKYLSAAADTLIKKGGGIAPCETLATLIRPGE